MTSYVLGTSENLVWGSKRQGDRMFQATKGAQTKKSNIRVDVQVAEQSIMCPLCMKYEVITKRDFMELEFTC